MPTLTVKVSADLAARLKRASEQRGLTKSELARRAIEKEVPKPVKNARPSLYDLMKDGLGCVDSGVPDLATNKKYMKGFGRWNAPKL